MEEKVEKIEVWIPCKQGEGTAVRQDGTQMKRVAILINGIPVFLEKEFAIEKGWITKEEAEQYKSNFKS